MLNAKITALETEGSGKIISAPKIITLDNKAATIKQGVEVPYATVSADGTKVEFKEVDLSLKVTPHVTPDDRISMKIAVTKNDVISDTSPPALSTNEANTELLVNDGDTIVIGGIMRSTQTTGAEGFPYLMDVPFLGWLFKTESEQATATELLIFITPNIVKLEQRQAKEET